MVIIRLGIGEMGPAPLLLLLLILILSLRGRGRGFDRWGPRKERGGEGEMEGGVWRDGG